MKSGSIVVIIIVVVSVVCCTIAACGLCIAFVLLNIQTGNFNAGGALQAGEAAPDFELKTIDGEDVALHDFRGQPVMLNFWALWCGTCIEEMLIFQTRFQQHSPGLIILAVEDGGPSADVRDFVQDEHLTFRVLSGTNTVARSYNVFAYPTTFFVDADGTIQSVVVGSLSAAKLDAELAKIGVGD